MLGNFFGPSGRLKTLLDRLTSTRATNLDNLDAAISTRAPSSTALSNAVWTDARAGKLDNVTVPILDKAPIASGLVLGASYQTVGSSGAATVFNTGSFANHNTTSTTYVDAVNVTGSGYLTGLFHVCPADTTLGTETLELIIDGVTVVTTAGNNTTASTPDNVKSIVGYCAPIYPGSTAWKLGIFPGGPVIFKTSLQIRHKTSDAGVASVAYYSYVRTS